jgi:hypothetical protein
MLREAMERACHVPAHPEAGATELPPSALSHAARGRQDDAFSGSRYGGPRCTSAGFYQITSEAGAAVSPTTVKRPTRIRGAVVV